MPVGGGKRDPLDRREEMSGASMLERSGEAGPGRAPVQADGPRRRRRRGSETLMVPEAEFASYYGRPIIKPPVWHVMDIAGYLYLGGLAGSSSVVGALADATGRPTLRKGARLVAGGAAVVSTVALVHDLGVPTRFINMLRVFKWTSPMNVGSWILAPFATLAGVAMATELPGLVLPVAEKVAGRKVAAVVEKALPGVGSVAGAGSAFFGPALTTYTAVLIADTAVPAWHEVYPELPFVFAASGIASAGGAGMVAAPVSEASPARRMGVLGAGAELALMQRMESRIGMVGEVYHQGRSGALLKASRVALVSGGVGALLAPRLGRWGRAVQVVSGLALNAGAALTRFGIYEGGVASAKDPKYTVVPQRERLEARRADRAAQAAAATGTGRRGADASPPQPLRRRAGT